MTDKRDLARFGAHDDRLVGDDKMFDRVHAQIGSHDTRLDGLLEDQNVLATRVEGIRTATTALQTDVLLHTDILVVQGSNIARLADRADVTDTRIDSIETSGAGEKIDWLGAFVIAGIFGVISAVVWWALVFGSNFDPLLFVQNSNIETVKSDIHAMLVFHVGVYTLVCTAVVFAICVCILTKQPDKKKSEKTSSKTVAVPVAVVPSAPSTATAPALPSAPPPVPTMAARLADARQ
ncbi:hypothetical protein H0W80_01355 [Candidatus Saccharibacteria bacterium]|nr:hypothetical protein [Candidatus Saccharibacteria bacterium]